MLSVPALGGWLYKHHLLSGGAGEKWHKLVQGHFWFVLESLHHIPLIKNCQFTLAKILVWRRQTIGVGQLKSCSCLQICVHFQTLLKPVPEAAHLLWCAKWWKMLWLHVTVRQAEAAKKNRGKILLIQLGLFVFACLFVVLFVCFFAFLTWRALLVLFMHMHANKPIASLDLLQTAELRNMFLCHPVFCLRSTAELLFTFCANILVSYLVIAPDGTCLHLHLQQLRYRQAA